MIFHSSAVSKRQVERGFLRAKLKNANSKAGTTGSNSNASNCLAFNSESLWSWSRYSMKSHLRQWVTSEKMRSSDEITFEAVRDFGRRQNLFIPQWLEERGIRNEFVTNNLILATRSFFNTIEAADSSPTKVRFYCITVIEFILNHFLWLQCVRTNEEIYVTSSWGITCGISLACITSLV